MLEDEPKKRAVVGCVVQEAGSDNCVHGGYEKVLSGLAQIKNRNESRLGSGRSWTVRWPLRGLIQPLRELQSWDDRSVLS